MGVSHDAFDRIVEQRLSFVEEIIQDEVSDALRLCQSPIGQAMAASILCCTQYLQGCQIANLRQSDGAIVLKGDLYNTRCDRWLQFDLTPQMRAGRFIVDFSFTVIECFPPTSASEERQSGLAAIAIECDGHAFHEKTKQQAAHDKRRDRYLSGHFDAILRFTGSEIYENPDRCACEAWSVLASKAQCPSPFEEFVDD